MFSNIFLRRKSNESILVTSQEQDYMGSQQQQRSTEPNTAAQPSDTRLEKRLEDASAPYPNNIARFDFIRQIVATSVRALRALTEIHESSCTGMRYKGINTQ